MSKYGADITLLVIGGGAEETEEWPVRARHAKRKAAPSPTPFAKRPRGVFTYKAPSPLRCDEKIEEKRSEPPPPPPSQTGTMTNDIVRALVFGILFIGMAYLIKEETDYARPLA